MITMAKAIICAGIFAMALQSVEPAFLPAVREFRKNNLGLFDISSDGTLLLMHQYGRFTKATTRFKARVLKASDASEVASIDIELPTNAIGRSFSESRQSKRQMIATFKSFP